MTHPAYIETDGALPPAWTTYRIERETALRGALPGRYGGAWEGRHDAAWGRLPGHTAFVDVFGEYGTGKGAHQPEWPTITYTPTLAPGDACPCTDWGDYGDETVAVSINPFCWLCHGTARVVGDLQPGREPTEEEASKHDEYASYQRSTLFGIIRALSWMKSELERRKTIAMLRTRLETVGADTTRCSILAGQVFDDQAWWARTVHARSTMGGFHEEYAQEYLGEWVGLPSEPCPECEGRGRRLMDRLDMERRGMHMAEPRGEILCWRCDGHGRVYYQHADS